MFQVSAPYYFSAGLYNAFLGSTRGVVESPILYTF